MILVKLWLLFNLLFLAVAFALPARAQTAPSPQVRALSERIMSEINTSLACSAALLLAQDKIKELEDKLAKKEQP